jgi:hypothetical protein
MPLIPGTKLKLYEILAPLGARSMGEVWARDSKLSREVTIKPLHAGPASDALHTARSELSYVQRHARGCILTDRS